MDNNTNNNEYNFKDGWLVYTTERVKVINTEYFDNEIWKDGFCAFSNDEFKINDKNFTDCSLYAESDLFTNKITKNNNLGFLMELNLWKSNNSCIEEVSIEREDDFFLVQKLSLFLEPDINSSNRFECYYKDAQTKSGKKLFRDDELKSVEVIVPEKRLHFFITKRN